MASSVVKLGEQGTVLEHESPACWLDHGHCSFCLWLDSLTCTVLGVETPTVPDMALQAACLSKWGYIFPPSSWHPASNQLLPIYFIPSLCFSFWSSLLFKLEYSPIISFQQMGVSTYRLRGIRASCLHLHVAYFHTSTPNLPMLTVPVSPRFPKVLCLGRWSHVPYKKKKE